MVCFYGCWRHFYFAKDAIVAQVFNYYYYYCTIFGSLSRNRYGIAPHKSLWSEIMPSWQDFLSTLLAQSCIFQRKSPIYPYVLYRNGLKHFFDNADDMSDLNTIINKYVLSS